MRKGVFNSSFPCNKHLIMPTTTLRTTLMLRSSVLRTIVLLKTIKKAIIQGFSQCVFFLRCGAVRCVTETAPYNFCYYQKNGTEPNRTVGFSKQKTPYYTVRFYEV